MTIWNKEQGSYISLPFNLHCKAIAAIFFIPYCRLTWGHCPSSSMCVHTSSRTPSDSPDVFSTNPVPSHQEASPVQILECSELHHRQGGWSAADRDRLFHGSLGCVETIWSRHDTVWRDVAEMLCYFWNTCKHIPLYARRYSIQYMPWKSRL